VSKAHDESSRRSEAPAADGGVTPGPDQIPADGLAGAAKRPAPVAARRVRSAPQHERSGPIGIASGDFATPSVRKRTITQPRGTPVAGVPLNLDPPLPLPVSPPVPAEPPAMGATPVDLVEARGSGRTPSPPPIPSESPFNLTEAGQGELDNESAVLAAEAAAVRALDSGPMTPLPEVILAPPTPLPVLVSSAPTPPPVVELAPPTSPPVVEFAPPTPPPVVVFASTPPPVVVSAPPTPPPVVVSAPPTPAPELTSSPTPPPAVVAKAPLEIADPTPPPEPHQKTAAPEPAALPDAPVLDVAGALPVRPMGSEGSAASADLSSAAAAVSTPAPAPIAELESDVPDHELEVLDGNEAVPGDDVTGVPISQVKETSRPTGSTTRPPPPPIPGSYLKTPGPELRTAPPAVVEESHAPLLPALPILPEALSLRPRRPKRSKPWFEEVFDEDYLRTLPFMRADQTLREVEFIADALQADPGSEILDVGCGYGRHAIELVQRGYNVTGLDLSLPLLIRAADEAQRRALSVNFVHADMREMSFEKQFDGAYSMLTSFGYFDEETNLRVAERIGRALKPGRRFLLDVINRDYVVADLPVRVWWEGTGCVVLEEVDFNFHTSRINTHRSIVFEDGRQLEQELSVRAYSLHEIGRLLRQAGFRVIDVSGGLALRGQFFGAASRSLLIIAEKREEDA